MDVITCVRPQPFTDRIGRLIKGFDRRTEIINEHPVRHICKRGRLKKLTRHIDTDFQGFDILLM